MVESKGEMQIMDTMNISKKNISQEHTKTGRNVLFLLNTKRKSNKKNKTMKQLKKNSKYKPIFVGNNGAES